MESFGDDGSEAVQIGAAKSGSLCVLLIYSFCAPAKNRACALNFFVLGRRGSANRAAARKSLLRGAVQVSGLREVETWVGNV